MHLSETLYSNPEFDELSENYDEALEKGIAVLGEHKEFFAKGRVDVPVSLPRACRLLEAARFQILRKDFMCIFPRFLRWLRRCKPALSGLPFGTQYPVLGSKED